MAPGILLAIYALLIMTASMAGGLAPALMHFTHRQLHLLMSLVAGLMLGVAVFHLLPHAAESLHSVESAANWLMAGLLGMFFLIRAFHFHQHASLEPDDAQAPGSNAESEHSGCLVHEQGTPHDQDHDLDSPGSHTPHSHDSPSAHKLSWLGIGFGLSIHTLIDGMALGASVQADAAFGGNAWFAGVPTFLAIALHKPLDAMSITTLMASAGWSRGWRFAANAAFAAMCPVGVLLFLGIDRVLLTNVSLVGASLAFSAGVFLCISLGDLLPEIQFHHHDRFQLSLALLAGVLVAWCLHFLEPNHVHRTEIGATTTSGQRPPISVDPR